MTHGQMIAELERFHEMLEQLSREMPNDQDFWPAYAEQANALEAACPHELRDYARDSILRSAQRVNEQRAVHG